MGDHDLARSAPLDALASSLSRRDVLKGMAGVAGIAATSSLLAACGGGASPSAAASQSAAASASTGGSPSAAASVGGSVTLGSNYSDTVPMGVLKGIVDTFTKNTGVQVKINTVSHGPFQDNISSYLQATPDDVFTWFSGFRMRFFAAQGLATDISDVWGSIGSHYGDAFKIGSTGDDGKQYF